MQEVFPGPRGRPLPVPEALRQKWAAASPKPSRSQRELDVLRAFVERQALETIQLHVLLTAATHRLADEAGGVSFAISELEALKDVKRLVSVSASDQIGEVRVLLPKEERPEEDPHALILPPQYTRGNR